MPIVWTVIARQDVNEIWAYLETHNPDAAELAESQIIKADNYTQLKSRVGQCQNSASPAADPLVVDPTIDQ